MTCLLTYALCCFHVPVIQSDIKNFQVAVIVEQLHIGRQLHSIDRFDSCYVVECISVNNNNSRASISQQDQKMNRPVIRWQSGSFVGHKGWQLLVCTCCMRTAKGSLHHCSNVICECRPNEKCCSWKNNFTSHIIISKNGDSSVMPVIVAVVTRAHKSPTFH